MYERFTDRARKVMQLANREAQRFGHEYIGTEHILLGLVKEGSGVAANVLKNLDVDLRKIRLEVERIVQPGAGTGGFAGRRPHTPWAKKVIEYSIEEARNLNHNYVGTEHLLLGVIRGEEGVGAQVLLNLGLKVEDVRQGVLNLLGTHDARDGRLDVWEAVRQKVLDLLGCNRPSATERDVAGTVIQQPDEPANALPAEFAALDSAINRLTYLMEQAIAGQDFEGAARLRDLNDLLKQVREAIVRRLGGG